MRFLLVDDDPLMAALIRRVAEGCGFEVETTAQANTFKAAYESHLPDVIGLDLVMPDCDGIEVLRYLADKRCQAEIFIISGIGSKMLTVAKDLGVARGLKMAGTISKPMAIAEMRTLLDGVYRAA